MAQLGRISGQLLKDNLTRDGHNLSFDTDLLHLDVNNRRIGINTDTPFAALQVIGTIRADNLIIDRVDIDNNVITSIGEFDLTLSAPEFYNIVSTTNLLPSEDILYNIGSTESRWNLGYFNDLIVNNSNSNSVFTGDLSVGGNTRLGDANTDTVEIPAEFISNLVPDLTTTFDLGTADQAWKTIYVSVLDNGNIKISDNLIATTLGGSNLELDAAGTGTIELKTNSNITGTLGVTQDVTLDANLAANGGNLTTTATTFNLLSTNATTVNFADAADTVNIAKLDSLTTIKGNLDVDQQATLASVNVEDLTSGRVVLAGTNGLLVDSANLTFNGTLLTVTGDQHITGDLDIDGNIRIGGSITIGDQETDVISVVADFTSDLVPDTDLTFDLGRPTKRWNTVYAGKFVGEIYGGTY